MVVTKDSPHRRRSIAVASHGQSSAVPRRRRAYSVAPRTSLSPQAKARRLLVPRKSILKTSFTPDDDDESPPTQDTRSTQATFDDADVTQSMDFTQDFRARLHDNTSRKSLGRRVSFAEHAHVRVFQIPDKNHANNANSPRSPDSPSSDPHSEPSQSADENDYPQASSSRRRRSSIRFSTGSEDMDMTTVMDHPPGSAILDEEFDEEEGLSDDMKVTKGGFARNQSLSMGADRRDTLPPSAILDMSDDTISEAASDGDQDQTQSSVADHSIISEAASDKSQAMEFTVPLNKSLRPPAHEDAVWLALRQATHSGHTPYEPTDESLEEDYDYHNQGDMQLDDAVQRLIRARDSLSAQHGSTGLLDHQTEDDTISSMNNSSIDDDDRGDQTMNVSKILGRISMGGGELSSRTRMGFGETSIDESEVYGDIVAVRRKSVAPRQSLLPTNSGSSSGPLKPEQTRPSVFHPPAPAPPAQTPATQPSPAPSPAPLKTKQLTTPNPFSFTTRPTTPFRSAPSPAKAKHKPVFTAAFAPLSTRTSPKKAQKQPHVDENKTENTGRDKPSPAKRQSLVGKGPETSTQVRTEAPAPPVVESTAKTRPLSPSKESPFQSMGTRPPSQEPAPSTSSLQRPSGYMARRKSLAVGTNAANLSSKKLAGRMSLASAPQDAWTRFNKDTYVPKKSVQIEEAKEPEPLLRDEVRAPEERSPSPSRRGHVVRIVEPGLSPEQIPMNLSTINKRDFAADDMDEDPPLNKTEQWRDMVENAEHHEEEEIPVISISQFFSMTAIKFMDELTAPRRSIYPSQHPTRQTRDPHHIPVSEYVVAMAIDIPQLELYTRVSRDLEAWMEKSKIVFAEAEEEAAKVTPELFVEYAKADEEAQAELMHQLNFIKINTRGHAKSDWYDWKLKWVEGLRMTADKAFSDLESDARKLEVLSTASADVIPDLEREYAQIMAELEKEQAEVAEIEACDQEYLNELKASIAEQNIEVEALKAEVAEHMEQLKWLEARRQETDSQKREIQASIEKSERIMKIQKSSTRTEVFRLKDELEALEDLHMVRVVKVNPQLLEYIYDSTFRITIPCKNYRPIVPEITITRLEHILTRSKDDFPKLTSMLLACATEILEDGVDVTVPRIVHKLADYWTSCAQLRLHIRLLNINYPVDIDIAPKSSTTLPTFRVCASVMFPKKASKAIVSYIFNLQTFRQWPLSIDSLDCAVDISYGPLDRNAILKAVVDRLARATPSDNDLLLDSCIEAQNLYK